MAGAKPVRPKTPAIADIDLDEVVAFDPGAGPPYLSTPRALIACAREFDRLAAEVSEQAALLDLGAADQKADIKRAPGRCIVQAGPVALTVSWIKARADTVAEGRLLVIEWEGQVGGAPPPSTSPTASTRVGAKILREHTFVATATTEEDWSWKRTDNKAFQSKKLATHYVASLKSHLAERVS